MRNSLTIMEKRNLFRFVCILVLWFVLVYLLLTTRRIDFMVIFTVIASGIIVFVPLYKKYFRDKDN